MANWLDDIGGPQLAGLFQNEPMVLVDVGAAGTPPGIWLDLAPDACFVGFDPDCRDREEKDRNGFQRFVMVDKAVTPGHADEVTFYLTRSPHCSSMLPPDPEQVSHYSFSELFVVEGTATVPATTLEVAVRQAGLERIDWLKLDSQGHDWDIFDSLEDELRGSVLALDVEPGIVPFYQGENTLAEIHPRLVAEGFWLAGAAFQEWPRIEEESLRQLQVPDKTRRGLPGSPTALEARYFRTMASLRSLDRPLRDLACLWAFAMRAEKPGFAVDLALEMCRRCGQAQLGGRLLNKASQAILQHGRQRHSWPLRVAQAVLPKRVRAFVRNWLRRL